MIGGARARDGIVQPLFLVSTPRSGSTLLFETLVQAPDLYTVGSESHQRIEQVADFFPGARGWSSNRLDASDASDDAVDQLAAQFFPSLRDRDGRPASNPVRMLEKTPKNALRVPFFASAWPDATFIYLYRDPRETLSSMLEAWASGRFRTYTALPGWSGPPWSLLLTPGWRDLNGRSLPEIVAHQWATTTSILIDDLAQLDEARVVSVDYRQLVDAPQQVVSRLARDVGLGWDRQLPDQLPFSRFTVSIPAKDKWRRLAEHVEPVMPIVREADERARTFLAGRCN